MLINEVALGQCIEVFKHDTKLKPTADKFFNSSHGVKRADGVTSDFEVSVPLQIVLQ